jgi:hypothetical protein
MTSKPLLGGSDTSFVLNAVYTTQDNWNVSATQHYVDFHVRERKRLNDKRMQRDVDRLYTRRHKVARKLLPYFKKYIQKQDPYICTLDSASRDAMKAIPMWLVWWLGKWVVQIIWDLLSEQYFLPPNEFVRTSRHQSCHEEYLNRPDIKAAHEAEAKFASED